MEIEKKDIRSLSKEQLRDFFVANNDKAIKKKKEARSL